MTTHNFDEIIVRSGTGCVKWDEAPASDIIPLWVADMDFAVAAPILKAIQLRAQHPVFGYTHVQQEYYDAVTQWFSRRHHWNIQREEIMYTTGVVPAMSVALKAFTMPGEKVLILSPDYNCFFSSIRNNGCGVLETALVRVDTEKGHPTFQVDWNDFDQKCSDDKCTVFLLCNPHNPTGRVWNAEELSRMNDICLRHGVKVVSDEIHCELIMPGHKFQPFAAVSQECRNNCVVLNSPSKSFNIAGLQTANIVCAVPEWRRRIDRAININEVCDLNSFGPPALIAAYNESEYWIDQLNPYLWQNYQAVCQFFAKEIPQLVVCDLEGTYLLWVDVSALLGGDGGFGNVEKLCNHLQNEGRVWVNPGTMYGHATGRNYIRLNIACPRQILMEALRRMKSAIG